MSFSEEFAPVLPSSLNTFLNGSTIVKHAHAVYDDIKQTSSLDSLNKLILSIRVKLKSVQLDKSVFNIRS